MPRIIQPLKTSWKIDEQQGNVKEQILDRVNSEDNYTNCKGYYVTEKKGWSSPLCPRIERIK